MNNIKAFVDGVKSIGNDGWNSLKTIADFLNYLMHPSLVISALWKYTQIYAFWICLLVAIISIICYSFGFKKFAKYVPASLAVYSFIKFIGSAL
jgi:hypothetical protein